MRVGVITGEYPPMQGGVGAYSQIIARRFADRGHDVAVFSDRRAHEDDARITLVTTRAWGPGTLMALRRWAHDYQLDVILLQFETAAFSMSPWIHFLPDALPVPVITCFHDLLVPYLFPKAGVMRDWIVMRLAQASDAVITTNHEDMRRLRELPFVELIPIGSNIVTNTPVLSRENVRESLGLDDADFLLAHFGFLNRSKGVDILLEDMALLRDEQAVPVHLLMIGGRVGASDPTNAAYASEIDGLIEQLSLIPYVHWTGFVEDDEVSAYLQAADVVVLPFRDGASFRRGSLMAAIHHGCAIITTEPKVYVPDFIDEENMLLVAPEMLDPEVPPFVHVTPQILRLYRDSALRERLRLGARELAGTFDWDAIVRAYINVCERVLKQHRQASHD